MRKILTAGLVGLFTGAALLISGGGATAQTQSLNVVGLTEDGTRLAFFNSANPRRVVVGPVIPGLDGDTRLVGIDFRVQNGMLYGVGDQGGIYTTTPDMRSAVKVSQLSVELDGTSFGVDFNPAADRLRIISDTGQNLRHNVNVATGGTITDGTLTYPPATTATTGVVGAGYTNNDLDANTATTLFDVDVAMDQVAVQSPANSGQLAGTGKLTVDAANAGFDVYSTVRGGVTTANEAFATLQVGGSYGFYRVDLLTGKATLVNTYGAPRIADIAIPLNQR